jgi:hypothetical protein
MVERREAAAEHTPGAARVGTPQGKVSADRERVILLELRLEQMRSALDEARVEADRARDRLAESAAREADHARRFSHLHSEMAQARAEVADLHRRVEQSEAVRAEMSGYLFESTSTADMDELVFMRRELIAERERAAASEGALARLRARVEELRTSRDMVLSRVAEWVRLVREEEPEAADLAEFIAELRGEVMQLERRSLASEAREEALRERLVRLGVDPGADPARDATSMEQNAPREREADRAEVMSSFTAAAEEPTIPVAAAPPLRGSQTDLLQTMEGPARPEVREAAAASAPPRAPAAAARHSDALAHGRTDAAFEELAAATTPGLRAELLLKLGRGGDIRVVDAIRPWTSWAEYAVRAAAYEALIKLLERHPTELEPHLRAGLADSDARVRRRVVLATATARKLALRSLLGPLKEDPDPQVRRVVREVLRQAPPDPDPGPEPPQRAGVFTSQA